MQYNTLQQHIKNRLHHSNNALTALTVAIARSEFSKLTINTRQPPSASANILLSLARRATILAMRLTTLANAARSRDSLRSPKLRNQHTHLRAQSLTHTRAGENALIAFKLSARKLQALNKSVRAFNSNALHASVINRRLAPSLSVL